MNMHLIALIPLFPLFSFVILILFGRRLGRLSPLVCVLSLFASGALTISIASAVFKKAALFVFWEWLPASGLEWKLGLSVDGMSWLMLVIVCFIGSMIAIYSMGYMKGDPRFSRYFAYFSLFCASMIGLVMANHFVLLYACWELVGLCSYLLISFWFEKPQAARAGRKAFITTRIGDTGLLIGIMVLALTSGQLSFDRLEAVRLSYILNNKEWLLTLISSLIFMGAVGKSAQVPLHVWLPDAMEGPTPVSALIHAATMVAAGVYLVARTLVLFTPTSLALVLTVGLFTHLMAATIALTMTDIKKVLAYSTISQLGLMMTALGLGSGELAMFHLTVHAFCKSLLFLSAGSIIHATHVQELSGLGGLWKKMPLTWACFFAAAFSLAGLPLLSAFWSKDPILLKAQQVVPLVFWALVVGAVLTATYLLRLGLLCFYGKPKPDSHAHESSIIMTAPMGILAAGALFIGLLGSPFANHVFFRLFEGTIEAEGVSASMLLMSLSIVAGAFLLAWIVAFKKKKLIPAFLSAPASAAYRLAFNKYYFDESYERFIIRPFMNAAGFLSRFDNDVIDGAVNMTGRIGIGISRLKNAFDRIVVDGTVNGIAKVVRACGDLARLVQTGYVSHYLFIVAASALIISVISKWR